MWEIKSAVSCSYFLVKEIELHIAWNCAILRWSSVTHVKVLRHRNLSINHNDIRRCTVEGHDLSIFIGFHGLITVDDGITPICQEQFG